MSLEFRRGSPGEARGHALIYFEAQSGLVATYVIVPPITFDLAKYVPPMLAGQLGAMPSPDAAGVPLPPVPELVDGGIQALLTLADARGDDLVFGGTIGDGAVERLLFAAAEAARAYTAIYRQRDLSLAAGPAASDELSVDSVLLELMGDHERVSELAKQIGRLRYGIEGSDKGLVDEAISEMERVGKHLAPKYRVAELISAASRPGHVGGELARLHIDRCYKLAVEDYAAIADIETRIKAIAETTG